MEHDARFVNNHGWIAVGGDLTTCAANEVRGSLRVKHNQQTITVANNTVGHDLVCVANEPAPTVYDNHVGGASRGQCNGSEPEEAQKSAETK
ncbi:MAG: hypothetical protein HC828_14950 [Blastochloris sp.]|nr:hypothetical protein [Blastochloris sp.]